MSAGPVVAVTGATGFLGLHLIPALIGQGARVRILARRDPTHEFWRDLNFEVVRGDLADAAALARLVRGANTVVHAAGLIRGNDRAAFLRINRDGVRAVADATRAAAPDARFILVSSLAARAPHLSAYAASKRAGEQIAITAWHDRPAQLVIIRPPAIYGPWDRETLSIFTAASRRVVPLFGTGRAALIHATDAAATIARCAMGAGEAGIYALADDHPAGYSMRELLTEAAHAVGTKPVFVPVPGSLILTVGALSGAWGQIRHREPILTLGKARELLHPDWSIHPDERASATIHRPTIGIGEGFQDTVAWYRAMGWLRRPSQGSNRFLKKAAQKLL